MSLTLRLHFARTLCLLMAICLLNFSIDYPGGNSTFALTGESFAQKPEQIESLLGMALDVHITIEEDFPEKTEKENEAETETADSLEFFHTHSNLSLTSVPHYLHEQLLHVPASDLKTLYPEVSYLPPKKTLFPTAV